MDNIVSLFDFLNLFDLLSVFVNNHTDPDLSESRVNANNSVPPPRNSDTNDNPKFSVNYYGK